jgi:peptidyl-prolyl isomerase G (cyclophilin G)
MFKNVFGHSGKHVVFGRIVSGYDVVKAIENTPVDDNDRPIGIVMIAQCGELELRLPPNYKGIFILAY